MRWGQVCRPWGIGPQRTQRGRHGVRVGVVGAAALQRMGVCARGRRPRAAVVMLLLLLLLLLLVVMVMGWGWGVGSGLAPSGRSEGARMGIAVG